jgi:hypothetical protein
MTEEMLMDAVLTMHDGDTTHEVFGAAVQGL